MALVLADRVKDTTTTTGTGTITLSGTAPSGFQNFSVIGNGNTTYYTIASGSAWEVGIGTYSSTGPTLSRDTVLSSSASGSKITLSGTSDVFVTYPAEKSVNYDASDNVGIGTSSPSTRLNVVGADGVVALISGATKGARFRITSGEANLEGVDNGGVSSYQPLNVGGSYLTLATGGTERMRIDSSGNVGIATSSPSTTLHVSGGLFAGSENRQSHPNASAGGGFKAQWNYTGGSGETDLYNAYSAASLSFRFYQTTGNGTAQLLYDMAPTYHVTYTGGSERMRIDSSGNVGIGTSPSGDRLNVSGTGQFTAASYCFVGVTSGSVQGQMAANGGGATVDIRAVSNHPMTFFTNNTERARIDSSGNVGIGTSAPGAKLDVVGNAQASNLYINATAGTLGMADNSASFILYNGTGAGGFTNTIRMVTNGAERLQIGPAGQIGLGGTNYGTSGQILTSNGSGSAPTWQNAPATGVTQAKATAISMILGF